MLSWIPCPYSRNNSNWSCRCKFHNIWIPTFFRKKKFEHAVKQDFTHVLDTSRRRPTEKSCCRCQNPTTKGTQIIRLPQWYNVVGYTDERHKKSNAKSTKFIIPFFICEKAQSIFSCPFILNQRLNNIIKTNKYKKTLHQSKCQQN